jgi:hypothetical protein
MLRRLTPVALTVLVVLLGVAALVIRPAVPSAGKSADYVVIVGVAGLRWDDVDPERTPQLWRLAERGAIGALSVRSAHRPTCPTDGWLTLGAGNYAGWPGASAADGCRSWDVHVEQPDGIGASVPEQRSVVRYNQEKLRWGAMPGALAESVRCTAAIGPGAAVAAARPFGRVDRYVPELPEDPAELLAGCVLSIVDLGAIEGDDPATRAAAASDTDAALGRVLRARPERSLVLVAGIADTDDKSRLHAVIADGPGWGAAKLTSGSTDRPGYVQLIDLAPTALTALGRPLPQGRFIGHPATAGAGRPADLPSAIAEPVDADREARAQSRIAGWFFTTLAVVECLLALAVVPLLRRARRGAGSTTADKTSGWVTVIAETLLVAAALAIPAALVADVVPWWRGEYAGLRFGAVTLLGLAVATGLVRLTRSYWRTLGPMTTVAALAVWAVGVDVLTGARLQLNGVVGYSAVDGGRYAGLGTVGLGVFTASLLLLAGCLAQRVRRSRRPAVMVIFGALGVVLVGSPYLGGDAVGAIALTAGVAIAAVISTGGWLTPSRLLWATMAGLAVTVGFALLDLQRPVGERSSIGRFLTALADGTGGLTVHRTSMSNFEALTGSSLTLLALAGAVLVWAALLQPWGGLKRLFGIYPAIRAAMAGLCVAVLLSGVIGGSALNVAGAAAALVIPLAVLAALRVLDHSADRTRPAGVAVDPAGAEPELRR